MNVSRIHRLLRLITLLQGRRSYSALELAEELEVSKRTVFRDLNMLEMAHIPYHYDADSGGYRIDRHFFLPPINLTLTEALALLALSGRINGMENVPLLGHGTKAALKVENALPSEVRKHVGTMLGDLHVKLGPVAGHDGVDSVFDRLAEAITTRKVCRLDYGSLHENELICPIVHPLKLVFVSRAWYLIAWSRMHNEIRTFKLSRVQSLIVSRERFARDGEMDLDEHFGLAWSMIPEGRRYNIKLRFSPRVSANVSEVRWHKTQETCFNGDGSLDFRVTVDGLGEISWWILGYGDQVEVLAPTSLRNRIASVAESVVQKYRQEGSNQ